MSVKCDRCDKAAATVHLIEIEDGQKVEKHLCESCAVEEGVAVKVQNAPINELLEKFVLKHSGLETQPSLMRCESCDLSYEQFRKSGLLGCPECYSAFERALMPLLERAHEGATHHLGKVPARAGVNELRQQRLRQLRRELEEAVASEQYEQAATLRDQLQQAESEEP